MIARVFAAAHLTVDAGASETFRQWRTEQQIIDAQTGVASECVPAACYALAVASA
jgi:hypothetical protein